MSASKHGVAPVTSQLMETFPITLPTDEDGIVTEDKEEL